MKRARPKGLTAAERRRALDGLVLTDADMAEQRSAEVIENLTPIGVIPKNEAPPRPLAPSPNGASGAGIGNIGNLHQAEGEPTEGEYAPRWPITNEIRLKMIRIYEQQLAKTKNPRKVKECTEILDFLRSRVRG